jgi:hypothetical protein
MTSFVRKNLITINSKIVPPGFEYWNHETNLPNPLPTQPTAVNVTLEFCNLQGFKNTVVIPMTLGTDGATWSCLWDSSAARAGEVTWVVYASGAVQAAQQGQFTIQANRAIKF